MQIKTFMTEKDPSIVRIQVFDEKTGETRVKKTTFKNYLGILEMNSYKNLSFMRIGKLPRGFLDASIAEDRSFKVAVGLPPMRRAALYSGNGGKAETYMLPYPWMLLAFSIEDGRLRSSQAFAGKEGEGTLCHFPFPNCYHSGNICWGNIKIPEINCLKDINLLEELFIGGIYGNDLFSTRHFSMENVHTSSPKAWFQFLNGKEWFPYEYLKPVIGIEEYMDGFLNKGQW